MEDKDLGTVSLLGKTGVGPRKQLEYFPTPEGLDMVVLKSDEMMSKCPITGQPDWYSIEIRYYPRGRCVESKSLKLYLQSFIEEEGIFGEALACKIAGDFNKVIAPQRVHVTLTQRPRGGISIISEASKGWPWQPDPVETSTDLKIRTAIPISTPPISIPQGISFPRRKKET